MNDEAFDSPYQHRPCTCGDRKNSLYVFVRLAIRDDAPMARHVLGTIAGLGLI
jgi:hypothetical protein